MHLVRIICVLLISHEGERISACLTCTLCGMSAVQQINCRRAYFALNGCSIFLCRVICVCSMGHQEHWHCRGRHSCTKVHTLRVCVCCLWAPCRFASLAVVLLVQPEAVRHGSRGNPVNAPAHLERYRHEQRSASYKYVSTLARLPHLLLATLLLQAPSPLLAPALAAVLPACPVVCRRCLFGERPKKMCSLQLCCCLVCLLTQQLL